MDWNKVMQQLEICWAEYCTVARRIRPVFDGESVLVRQEDLITLCEAYSKWESETRRILEKDVIDGRWHTYKEYVLENVVVFRVK